MIKLSDNQFLLTFSQDVEPPIFKVDKKTQWVKYGERNDYPNYLEELFRTSPNHGAVVRSKIDYVTGAGWYVDRAKNTAALALDQARLKKINHYHESLDEVTQKIVSDWLKFGWYAVEVIRSVGGSNYLYHLPVRKLRINKQGTTVAYCDDWTVRNPEQHESFKVLPLYDHRKPKDKSVFIYKDWSDSDYYPYPEYISAVPYIGVDREVAVFQLKAIKNGFLGGYLVNFVNGVPSVEEQEEIEAQVKAKLTGAEGERVLLNFADGPEKKVELVPLTPANIHEQFITLRDTVESQIFTAHRVDPVLMGVKTEGQLGGRTEIIEKIEWLNSTYVFPKQKKLEDTLGWLLCMDIKIQPNQPVGIEPPVPEKAGETDVNLASVLGTISPLVATKVLEKMTDDEVRSIVNLPALKGGQVITAQMSKDDDFSQWEKIGEDIGQFDILYGEEVKMHKIGDRYYPEIEEAAVKMRFAEYSKNQEKVLGVLKDNPKMSAGEIADVLELDLDRVTEILKQLQDLGALTIDGDDIKIDKNEVRDVEVIETRYRYVTRPDAPKLKTESRPFCKRLLEISRTKVFTREQIDSIRNPDGRSAWEYRGGWYTNPNNGVHTPFCRHMWETIIVRKKP